MADGGRHHVPRPLALVRSDAVSPDPSLGDVAYVAGVRRGDERVFTILVGEYVVPLTRYAYSFLGDEDAADDVVQDVFARIWQLGVDWRPAGTVAAYLFASVRHRALDTLRNASTRDRLQTAVRTLYELSSHETDPYVDVVALASVREAFQQLTERQQDVIRLRYGQGLPMSQVAEILRIDQRAAERLAVRALVSLRKLVGMDAPDNPSA